ncbi:hypothetical protein [Dactylosporangium sp. CA-092794]|uniref:hypothetical protein n=1 Tax=Dactylosporangium sp. CA-092794 TaxID=3239929 RepID=UPI003D8C55D8
MKRLVTGLALTAAIVVGSVGLGTAAQASAQAYHKQGVYNWGDQCLGVGYYGKQQGQWTYYYCVTVVPSGATGPGLYELWVE